jgi:hypothetical protein
MTNKLPVAVQSRVDAHLDAVEKQLQTAGADRATRRNIVDDLATQIVDMLGSLEAPTPTVADIDDVLGRLDPPQAYANESAWPSDRVLRVERGIVYEPRLCRQAKQGAWCIGLGILAPLLLVFGLKSPPARHVISWLESSLQEGSPPPLWSVVLVGALVITAAVAAVALPIAGTLLGWIATERIRRSAGTQYGLGLAVGEALLYPILLVWFVTYTIDRQIEQVLYGTTYLSGPGGRQLIPSKLLWLFWTTLLSIGLVCWLRWSTSPKRGASSRPKQQNGPSSLLAPSNQ